MNAPRMLPAPAAPSRILIVDDDPGIRDLLTRLLNDRGYRVCGTACCSEALSEIRRAPPDLVLLDLHLPDHEGLDVLEVIRGASDTRFLPVIMLTGDASRHERLRAIGTGVTDFMTKPFDVEELAIRIEGRLRLKSFTDQLEEAADLIMLLARTIDARDPHTAGHSSRVADYAGLLCARIGLGDEELAAVRHGAMLHDVGKIAVRDRVLGKRGDLTPGEQDEMRNHTVAGRKLIQQLRTLAPTVPIVYHHHEKLDGSGYPDGLRGDEIPLPVRVTTIADVYDALTSPRPYRRAFRRPEALRIMVDEARRGWWDLGLLREFADILQAVPERTDLPRPDAAPGPRGWRWARRAG